MDFKVTGTQTGITALQNGHKDRRINAQIMAELWNRREKDDFHILGVMEKTLATPREAMSEYAPRIIQIKINPEQIRDVIGPGGQDDSVHS